MKRPSNAHLESALESFFRKRVRLAGGYALKGGGIAGIPDRVCIFPGGNTAFVELKQKGQKPEPIQVVWHGRLRDLGYRVYVIDDRETVLSFVREMVNLSAG